MLIKPPPYPGCFNSNSYPLSKHAKWDNEASVAFLQPHLQLLLLQGLQSREVNLRLEAEVHKLGDTLGISRVDQNAAHRSEWASNRLLAMEVSQAAVGGPSLHWSKPSNPAGLTYCWFPHWLTRATTHLLPTAYCEESGCWLNYSLSVHFQ